MKRNPLETIEIRSALPEEYENLGRMTVDCYEHLPGMPGRTEQPDYYAMLLDVSGRANSPTTEIMVAVSPIDGLLGGVTFVGDMKYYNSGGSASTVLHSSGIRLLVVRPTARKQGVGKALTAACIRRARKLGKSRIVLHTTRSMEVAWKLYEKMGFRRSTDLDFNQGGLDVFGFQLHMSEFRG